MSLTVTEAARELGISDRQVREAIYVGSLEAKQFGSSYVISVRRLQAFSRQRHRGRNWSRETQEAALALLSGQHVFGLNGSEISRLKRRIKNADVAMLVGQIMRGRYSLRRQASSDSELSIRNAINKDLGLSESGGLKVLAMHKVSERAREMRLALDDTGDIVAVEGSTAYQKILEACALYLFGDVREHSAASDWLRRAQVEL